MLRTARIECYAFSVKKLEEFGSDAAVQDMRARRYQDIAMPHNHYVNSVSYKEAFRRWDYAYFVSICYTFLLAVAAVPALIAIMLAVLGFHEAAISQVGLALLFFLVWLWLPRHSNIVEEKELALFNLRAALDLRGKFEEVIWSQHQKATQILRGSQRFCLLLRSFSLEAVERTRPLEENSGWKEHELQNALRLVAAPMRNEDEEYYAILAACLPTVTMSHPSVSHNYWLNRDAAKLHLSNEFWQPVVARLIEDASLIVLIVSSLTQGVQEELAMISRHGEGTPTIAILVAPGDIESNPTVLHALGYEYDVDRSRDLAAAEKAIRAIGPEVIILREEDATGTQIRDLVGTLGVLSDPRSSDCPRESERKID